MTYKEMTKFRMLAFSRSLHRFGGLAGCSGSITAQREDGSVSEKTDKWCRIAISCRKCVLQARKHRADATEKADAEMAVGSAGQEQVSFVMRAFLGLSVGFQWLAETIGR